MTRRWSLHARWALTLAISVLLVVSGYGCALYILVRNERLTAVDSLLKQETKRLAGFVDIESKGIDIEHPEKHVVIDPGGLPINSLVADATGEVIERWPKDNGPIPPLDTELDGPSFGEHRFRTVTLENRPFRVVDVRLKGTRERHVKKTDQWVRLDREVTLAAWQDLSGLEAELAALLRHLGLLSVVTVAGAGFLGYFVAGRMLRPVSELVGYAELIEDLSERLPVGPARDELARLAQVINAMLERLESAGSWERRFLAHAAHEFRSPLTVLQGEIDLALRRPRDSAEYRSVLETCQTEVQGMSRLVEGLLFLARADAGTLQEEPRELLDLQQVVAECERHGQSKAGERVHCERREPELPLPVVGNRALLERMIMNLVENAIRHGGPECEVRIGCDLDNGQVLLSVEDNGPGIAPADLPHVFERFYRAERARSRATGGAGLGLAIAREIVLLHAGQITASNQPSGGARFDVRFPRATPPASAADD